MSSPMPVCEERRSRLAPTPTGNPLTSCSMHSAHPRRPTLPRPNHRRPRRPCMPGRPACLRRRQPARESSSRAAGRRLPPSTPMRRPPAPRFGRARPLSARARAGPGPRKAPRRLRSRRHRRPRHRRPRCRRRPQRRRPHRRQPHRPRSSVRRLPTAPCRPRCSPRSATLAATTPSPTSTGATPRWTATPPRGPARMAIRQRRPRSPSSATAMLWRGSRPSTASPNRKAGDLSLTMSTCSPATISIWVPAWNRVSWECNNWREKAIERLVSERPAIVVVAGTRGFATTDSAWWSHRACRRPADGRMAVGHAEDAVTPCAGRPAHRHPPRRHTAFPASTHRPACRSTRRRRARL